MECREFEKRIPAFLDGTMDHRELEQFIDHRKLCDSCREELDIQFLVQEGMQYLESGDNYDLQGELERRLLEVRRSINRRKLLWRMLVFAGIILFVALIISVVWMVF